MGLVRSAAVLIALLLVACGSAAPSSAEPEALDSAEISDHATLEPFDPPSPRGCGGAAAYDFCFAFDTGTPLAVRVALPRPADARAVAVVRFQHVAGASKRNLDEVKFIVKETTSSPDLYFQVDPGTYRVGFGFDVDGDGKEDVFGWSALVDVGTDPIATTFSVS